MVTYSLLSRVCEGLPGDRGGQLSTELEEFRRNGIQETFIIEERGKAVNEECGVRP